MGDILMKRCVPIISFFLATLFLASPGFGQKLRPVTLGFTGKSLTTLIFEMSIRRGHFKQQGLDVKLITIRQSDVIIKATMAGELDFMSIIPTAILASVRGLPIRTIAVNVDNAPYVLVGRPQIKSMKDLKGKKIAVSSLGSMSTLVVREIVARSGLDPDRDVTYLAVGGSETRSGAMAAGFVDAALMTIPLNFAPERQGYNRLAWAPDYVRFPINGVSGSPDYFSANRDLAVALLRGMAGGVRDVKQRKAEMVTFLKSYIEVPEDEAAKSYEFLASHMPDNMIVDDAVIKSAMEFAASALKLKPDAVPDISKVRDWSYARAATK
jgi:ABC-type nitrate/sulfonate/bicarbonate transport system substrate-binding protein